MAKKELSRLDESGPAGKVDVGNKAKNRRVARARGAVKMSAKTQARLRAGDLGKGNMRVVAELASVMADERTTELIPLCHPLPLTHIKFETDLYDDLPAVQTFSSASTIARTGVEMGALTSAALAASTVCDMIKGVERNARVVDFHLPEIRGGRRGDLVQED